MSHAHEHHGPLKDQLRELIAGAKSIDDDGKVQFAEVANIGAALFCAASHILSSMADPINGAGELADAAEALFDEYVGPLDIVGVPNVFEPHIKGVVRGNIRPSITTLVSYLGQS